MLKKCQVVMLQSNEKANIGDFTISIVNEEFPETLRSGKKIQEPYNCSETTFYLYITSDDKIKEGDWYLTYDNKVFQCKKVLMSLIYTEGNYGRNPNGCKKIIATTDSSLEIISKGINPVYQKLPQPSQQFIEKYLEEYNKSNQIVDVLVEHEEVNDFGYPYSFDDMDFGVEKECKLKVNPKDNTITIKKVKDSWNRDEIVKLLINHTINLRNKTNDLDFTNKWIEENL